MYARPMLYKFLFPLLSILVLLLAACNGSEGSDAPEEEDDDLVVVEEVAADFTRDWYVETTGDDDNSCTSVAEACQTILGAYLKSALGDRIHIGEGTFIESGMIGSILPIEHNISLIGAGRELTIIEGGNAIGGIFISPGSGASEVLLEGFSIQNTVRGSASACIDNRGSASLTVRGVEARQCLRAGIANTGVGQTLLIEVVVHSAVDEEPSPDFTLNGNGLEVSAGSMRVEASIVRDNPLNGITVGNGTVSLLNSEVSGNALDGIHVYAASTLDMDGLSLHSNGRDGLFQTDTRTRILNSEIHANGETALFIRGGSLRMEDSSIRDHAGRALHITETAVANLIQVQITNNGYTSLFRPVIWNAGRLSAQYTTIENNQQIAIYNPAGSQVVLSDSSLSHNSAGDTAFLLASGAEATLERVLIANNETGREAALLDLGGELRASNLTVSNNSGLGLRAEAPFNISYATIAQNGGQGTLFEGVGGELSNTLIAQNGGGDCNHASLDMLLSGSNYDSDGSCGFSATYDAASLGLGPLADNGGPTRTHALEPSSPAVDAAGNACPGADQRSRARPSLPADCDVGAFEISDLVVAILPFEFEEADIIEILPPEDEEEPYAVAIRTAACREGADALFPFNEFLFRGQKATLTGQLADGSWFKVELSEEEGRCWVFFENLEIFGNLELLAFLTPPELPSEPEPVDEDEGDSANQDSGGDGSSGGSGGGQSGSGQSGGNQSAPNAPSNATIDNWICTSQDYEVSIGWNDNADNEDGFNIYRDGQLLGSVGADVKQFVDNPPGSGPYTYSIEAFNNFGSSQAISVVEGGCVP